MLWGCCGFEEATVRVKEKSLVNKAGRKNLEKLKEGSMLRGFCELEEAIVRVTEKRPVGKGRREKGSEES